jgi:hypothetical protein
VPNRLIRSPNKAELALLRWLDAEPRPVVIGPIGQCVKRGWCKPAFKHVIDDGVQKTIAIYFVTSLGRRHLSIPDGSIVPDQDGPEADKTADR